MKFKREIELFWIRHGGRILFWIIISAVVITVTQILNSIAEKKIEEEKKYINENNTIQSSAPKIEYKENIKSTSFIKEFIYLCSEDTLGEAYDMLSEKCKTEKYKTLNSFYNNYYKKFFLGEYTYEKIKFNTEDNTYTLTFYESALNTGSLENRRYITSNIKLEEKVLETRIYILD